MTALGVGVGVGFIKRYPNQAPPGSPVPTASPVVSGTPQQGQTLSVTNGTWTNSPTGYTYQWRRNGAAISGATSNTYILQAADVGANISCTVTATNANGSNFSNSNSVGPVTGANAAPVNTVAPVISGMGTQGQTLTTTNGTWTGSPTPTYTYQWRRDGTAISGATSASYVLQAADVGTTITCAVTGTNSAGNATAVSNDIGPIAAAATAPAQMAAPTLTPGNTSIAVTRAADPSNGGSAITGYDLRYGTDGTNWTTVAMTTNPQTISGLANGTAYQVQTRAVNAVGAGAYSASATATPTAGQATTFSDNFNRPDENLEASPNWTRVDGAAGACAVASNTLRNNTAETAYQSPNLGSANHYVQATLQGVGSAGPFLAARLSNMNNFVGVRSSTTAYQLFKRIGGTLTQISVSPGGVTPTVGDVMRVEVVTEGDGTHTCRMLVNGTQTGSSASLPAGELAGITRQGVVARTVAKNPWLDDYSAGNL